MKKHSLHKMIPLCVLLLAFSVLTPLLGQSREAKLYAITKWDAGCSGSTRDAWDDMGLAWYDEITSVGFYFWGHWWFGHGPDAYSKDGSYINGSIADSWFTDSSVVWWGNDTSYSDEADACMVCLHGSESSGRWQGSVRVNESGPGNCRTWQGDMAFGDWDLEFLHLSSCHSLDDNQWFFEWLSSFDGLHQLDGFHGWMWIGSSLIGDYEDFADDAFDISIADAWLDNMYRPNISGSDDQCPVAYAVGANSADMWHRIGTERYNNVHSDPTTIGYVGCFYIGGCDPGGEDVCGDDAWSGTKEAAEELSYEYRDLVIRALPRFDEKILRVPERKVNWVERVSIPDIAKAAMDEISYEKRERNGYEQAREKNRVIKLDRNRGYIRYLNQDRQFQFNKSPRQPIEKRNAIEIAQRAIWTLGIPNDEISSVTADEVKGMGAIQEAKKPSDEFVKELLITVQRGLNDIPMFRSVARVAVSNEGEVSRLLIRWPHFNLRRGLRLKDRDHIVKEIAAQIERREEGKPIALDMQLAYVTAQDDEQTGYVPAIVVAVKDDESGVIFTVNIAE